MSASGTDAVAGGSTLTDEERAMAAGDQGEAVKWAMDLLVAMADYYGADGLVDVVGVHTHEAQYGSDMAGLELLERLVEQGATFRVPTSTNTAPIDVDSAEEWGVSSAYVAKHRRIVDGLGALGANPTRTCHLPGMGHHPFYRQHAAWGESSTTTYLNSVVGARVTLHSFPDLLAAGITGKAPRIGYHLDENRRGNAVVRITASMSRHSDWDALAIALATKLDGGYETVPVLTGLPGRVTPDHLKRLATIGAGPLGTCMFHAVGVTAEAPSLEAALGDRPPREDVEISEADIDAVYEYWSGSGAVDLVQFGCPHLSLNEYRELTMLFDGKTVHDGVRVLVYVPDSVKAVGDYAGYTQTLERAGCEIRLGSSVVFHQEIPELREQFAGKVMVTDSTRAAFYAPGVAGETNLQPVLRSREDAVEAAIAGQV